MAWQSTTKTRYSVLIVLPPPANRVESVAKKPAKKVSLMPVHLRTFSYYPVEEFSEGADVLKVNLLDYMNLAEQMLDASRTLARKDAKYGNLYFIFRSLAKALEVFIDRGSGFDTAKLVAKQTVEVLRKWEKDNFPDGWDAEKFGQDAPSWEHFEIRNKLEAFRHVLEAECSQVDVYAVGQISIYKTSTLVSSGSDSIPEVARDFLPGEAIKEFNDTGRCLAFGLPTAAGFHALRGLELAIHKYLIGFGRNTEDLKNWGAYVKAVQELSNDESRAVRPSKKVGAMLDRIRALDRNPLMHPQDVLDRDAADMLFRLVAVTVYEMAKDAKDSFEEIPLLPDQGVQAIASSSIV